MRSSLQSSELVPFGSYLLDELIAVGGMARVYRARLRGLGGFEKTLVVKQILPELATDPRFVTMFVEEAKTLVQLSHPHIVPVYELGVIDGVYFLSMEHVDGATLAEILEDGPLPPELAAHVGVQLAEALHFAHARFRLVHRDVTPRNVLVDGEGHVRLVDFGIAAPAHDESGRGLFGSPGYMSPEQLRGEPLSAASDLFSLGAVLYLALTGEPAFLRSDADATRAALLESEPPRLMGRAGIPEALAALVDRCLGADPGARPESGAEIARTLRGWLASEHPEGVAPALGVRATTARARARRSPADVTPTPTRPSEPGGSTQRLATSPVLAAMLEGAGPDTTPIVEAAIAPSALGPRTVPITGRIEPARPKATAPARPRRRAALGALVVVAAGVGITAALAHRSDEAADASAADAAFGRDERGGDPSATDRGAAHAPTSARPATTETAPPTAPTERPTPPGTPSGAPSPSGGATAGSGPTPIVPELAGAVASRASLSINATPWATVTVDGRSVGTTPLRHVAVSPGTHVLRFECPPLGRSTELTVRATAGETTRVLADLDRDPPTATAR